MAKEQSSPSMAPRDGQTGATIEVAKDGVVLVQGWLAHGDERFDRQAAVEYRELPNTEPLQIYGWESKNEHKQRDA